jgi:hypothetical protein
MRIPRFWTRAEHDGFEAPGWSFTSLEEALRVAQERVRLLADVITGKRPPQGRYLYGDRPVREPVVETIGERPDALITRNLYGALCLNTEDVVFVDVDDPEDANLERIRRAAAAHPGWGMRVYRTSAGFRVLGTHARMSPTGGEIGTIFDALGADPLYRKLCAAQESFRARLTPKPWRIGAGRIPARFPYRDDDAAQRAAGWVSQYDQLSRGHAVCQLLETHGPGATDPVIQRVVELHDARTLAAGKPLA